MKIEFLKQYDYYLSKLTLDEQQKRDLYLRDLSLGKICGPFVGIPNIDKKWLRFYSEEALLENVPECSIYEFLYKNNINNLDNVAISYFNEKITYKELFENINKVENKLLGMGVKQGDIVTLALPNIPENVYLLYALNKIGAVANMIDLRTPSNDLEYFINETGSKLVFATDLFIDNYVNVIDKFELNKVVVVSAVESLPILIQKVYNIKNKIKKISNDKFLSYKTFIKNANKNDIDLDINVLSTDPCCILHTSGTTGTPKGVMLSNKNLNAMTIQYKNSGLRFNKKDKFMNQVPPFLAYSIVLAIHMPLSLGMEDILLPEYNTAKFAENIIKLKPQHAIAGPADWNNFKENDKVSKADLSFLSTLASGGDKMSNKEEINNLVEKQNCKAKIIEGYGMTEVGSSSCTNLPNCNISDSVGVPLPKMNFCIYDNDNDTELGYNENGEICISGDTTMLGYYNNDETTKSVIKIHADGKKWVHTGDLGYFSENGNLYLIGRIKRVIVKFDGHKIAPFGIEKIIKTNPLVDDCCLVGVKDNVSGKGSIPVAYITIKEDVNLNSDEIILSIENDCKTKLKESEIPNDYVIIDKMPLTSVGKVDYRKLEAQYNLETIKEKTI